jgi:hypothetical protein
MKISNNNIFILIMGVCTLVVPASCKKDYKNPNAATGQEVFSSPQGLTGVAIGLQRLYTAGRASSLYNKVSINGLLTNELVVLNQGNTSEYQLQLGGSSVDPTNTMILGLWASSNKIIYDADNIINGAAGLGDRAYANGLLGYATIFKALGLGDLAEFWEKIPDGTGKNVGFIDRMQGYARAISAIDNALVAINTTPISSGFLANIPAGIDIVNTLHALKARYALFMGNYQTALTEANAVNLNVKSTFNFTSVNLNPIFETSTSTNNVTGVGNTATLGLPAGLQPDPNDKRLPFYTTSAYASKILGFAAAPTTAWPVYLPGEMTLIKAEAYARMTPPDLVNALIELNKVVTKQPAADPFGVGAGLAPIVGPLTQQQILDLIYQQRCIELFMLGLKMEDMRRFGRPNSEKKRNLLPYPFQERDNNPNTPYPDPAF